MTIPTSFEWKWLRFDPWDEKPLTLRALIARFHGDEFLVGDPAPTECDPCISGPPNAVIHSLQSSRHYTLWDQVDTYETIVEPEAIVFTDHSDYQRHYSEDDSGELIAIGDTFPGKKGDPGDGYLSGWNRPLLTDRVTLLKHPELPKYVVIYSGNHRVMKSKLLRGPAIHCSVIRTQWRPTIKIVLESIAQSIANYPQLVIEQVLPCSVYPGRSVLVFQVRSVKLNSRRFYFRIKNGIFDHEEIQRRLRISEASVGWLSCWREMAGALILNGV